ncbi:MAG: translation initiation factor eIF-2B [Ignavibacteriaceae bacterium]|nr:translation initiation factor eIF-2B [Ignavibacteriaceae bacterium]
METQLNKILSDTTSGSVDLLSKLTLCISNNVESDSDLKELIKLCTNKFSTFAIINSFITSLKIEFEQNGVESAKLFSRSYYDKISKNIDDLFATAFEDIKNFNSVLTISNSKTILEVIKKLKKHNANLKVIALESRPKNEGRIFSKALLKNEIEVTFIVDAAAGLFVNDIDAVFCGADKILVNNSVVNKIGSMQLALLCKEYKKPFYVFCDEEKFTAEAVYMPSEIRASEIWNFTHPGLTINNFYFEVIPNHLITKIFTEKHSITP